MRLGSWSQVDSFGGTLLAFLICFAVVNAAIGIPQAFYYLVFGLLCLNSALSFFLRKENPITMIYAALLLTTFLWLAAATAVSETDIDGMIFALAASTFTLAVISALRRGDRFYGSFVFVLVSFSVLVGAVLVVAHFSGRGDFRRSLSGGYLSFGMLLSVAAAIMAPYLVASRGKTRLFLYLAVAPLYLGLIVSQARGALLFTLSLTALIFFLYWPRKETERKPRAGLTWRLILFGGGAALVANFLPPRTLYRLERMFFREGGEANRWEIWETSWEAFMQSPLLGHGAGYSFGFDFAHPHNLFLQFAVDSGVLGIFLLFVVIIFPIIAFFQHRSGGIKTYPPLLVGLFAAYIVMLLEHSKSGDIYAGRSLFILAGLVLATALRKPGTVVPRARSRFSRLDQGTRATA